MNRSSRAWLAGVLILLTAGCAVDQAREVQTYRNVLDAGQEKPPAPFSPGESLTLQRALELANANNEQLALAGEGYLQALIAKDRAFARFLPTIGFVPSYMRQERSSIGAGNPLIGNIDREEHFDAPVQGNLKLSPFQDVPGFRAAGVAAEQQRAHLLDRQSILLLDVAQTFYQVLRSEKQVDVLEHTVQMQQQRVKDMDVQQRAGVARPVDVAQGQAQLAGTLSALIQARNDVRNGRATLAQLIGVPAAEGLLVDALEVVDAPPPLDRLLARPMRSGRIVAARMQVRAAGESLDAAGGIFPVCVAESDPLSVPRELSGRCGLGGTDPG